jgi:hypothetical protein
MAGYDTLVALVVQPNAQQLWNAEDDCSIIVPLLEKFQPGVQNVSPQTISASNKLHRVCLRFQLTNLEYKMFPPKQHM